MSLPQKFSSPGLVLQSKAFRESDSIVTLLTQQCGKLSAIARGVRRSKKRFMGGIEPFDYGIFELSSARNRPEWHTIEGLSNRHVLLSLRSDFFKLSLSSYCLELATAFTHEGEKDAGRLFNHIIHCLRSIDSSKDEEHCYYQVVLFNLRLLSFCGYNPTEDEKISPAYRSWFADLLAGKLTHAHLPDQQTRHAFMLLCNNSQQIIGHPFASLRDSSLAFNDDY
ncbi:MAG: DNA repair protein RecO [Deltaproteobacteria bacterium]|nr:DNA repair protein RecO [Deltaproteobacteria bacterium]